MGCCEEVWTGNYDNDVKDDITDNDYQDMFVDMTKPDPVIVEDDKPHMQVELLTRAVVITKLWVTNFSL